MKTLEQIEEELILKEQRVEYWEKHHSVPKVSELMKHEKHKILL